MLQFLLPVTALLAGSFLVIVALALPLRDRDHPPSFVEDPVPRHQPPGGAGAPAASTPAIQKGL